MKQWVFIHGLLRGLQNTWDRAELLSHPAKRERWGQ
jgi:hypothetical protein